MAELKKCPFCGGEGEIEYERVDGLYQKYYSWVHVVCQKCYATTGRTYDDKDRSKGYAIKVWNNRPTEAEIRAKAEHTYENCHNITCRRKCRKDGYNMAIDEFAERCKELVNQGELYDYVRWCNWNNSVFKWFDRVAEQLKEEQ